MGDIFADEFNGNINNDDFLDFAQEIELETRQTSDASFDGGQLNTERETNTETTLKSAASEGRQRSIRFADDVDPNGVFYSAELETSLPTLDVLHEGDFSKALGSINNEEDDDDDQKFEEDEDDEEDDAKKQMMYSAGVMGLSIIVGFLLRMILRCFARRAEQDMSAVAHDTTTDAADTATQAKTAVGATGHGAAGVKSSTEAAMQASFNASSNASQSSSHLAGGFVINNPSSAMSGAQYVYTNLCSTLICVHGRIVEYFRYTQLTQSFYPS